MADLVYKLRRGIKLMLEHVYTPVQTFLTRVTSTGISSETMSTGRGTFRLSLHQPAIDHAQNSKTVIIPFILPPLQEYFAVDGSATRPSVRLEEVSIGFDQMGGATAIKGRGSAIGTPDEALAGNLKFKVSLRAKKLNLEGIYDTYQDEVWSTELSAANFQSWTARSNPIAIDNLHIDISQNASYALCIEPTKLTNAGAAADYIAIWSLLVSLKFSHDLIARDSGATIQNIPSAHDGARAVSAKVFTPPASDAVITADTATGVSKAFELLDSYVRSKYRGGYLRDSTRHDTAPFESILTDAGYEVIAVPMFGNLLSVTGGTSGGGGLTPNTELPYVDLAGGWDKTGQFFDRRIIPIQYPLTVHHVICARNYSTYATGGNLSLPSTFTEYVGVGIGAGLLGQKYTYEQVAFAEFGYGSKPNIIDRIGEDRVMEATGSTDGYIWELHSVPLVHPVGTTGAGYVTQGKPYYAGRSITNTSTVAGYTPSTSARRNVGIGHGAGNRVPNTAGHENFIEVRWKFLDSQSPAGIEGANYVDSDGNKSRALVGFGGNWVYLICKKHLV
jgi:hypothetical protein